MIEIKRKEFKKDPIWNKLFELIKSNHKVATHTERTLRKNKHIKDFCEEARHFMILPSTNPVYLHYDVATWWKEPNGVSIKFESIGVYDDIHEYELARYGHLNSTKDSDQNNLN